MSCCKIFSRLDKNDHVKSLDLGNQGTCGILMNHVMKVIYMADFLEVSHYHPGCALIQKLCCLQFSKEIVVLMICLGSMN